MIAAGLNGTTARAQRHMGIADGQGIKAELVGEADAHLRAAGGDVSDFAQRDAGKRTDIEPTIGEVWRCGPGSHPLRMRRGLGARGRGECEDERGKGKDGEAAFQHH